jgi:hypothetical protein
MYTIGLEGKFNGANESCSNLETTFESVIGCCCCCCDCWVEFIVFENEIAADSAAVELLVLTVIEACTGGDCVVVVIFGGL